MNLLRLSPWHKHTWVLTVDPIAVELWGECRCGATTTKIHGGIYGLTVKIEPSDEDRWSGFCIKGTTESWEALSLEIQDI